MHEEQYEGGFWYAVAAGLLLTLAAAVRFRLLGTTLFEDEVWVANLLHNGGLAPHTYNTPPLFYAIGRFWVSMRGMSDVALREPAAIFGVALCAMPLAAPRPLRVRFVWSLLLAFSSPLLFYSTRLKQYTLEAFVITLLIVLFLRAYEGKGVAMWIAFFLAAAAAVMTLHTPVFPVAAMGAIVVFTRRVRNAPIIAGFVITGALAAFAFYAYMAPGPASVKLHGNMDEWFTATGRWVTSPASFIANSKHWIGQSMNLVPFWWALLVPLMLVWLFVERDLPVVALAALPPLAIVATSMLHKYPYGEVRLMIFCFPALYLAVAEAFSLASRRVPLLLVALAPFVILGVAREPYNSTYMQVDDLRPVVTMIANGHRDGEPVYADPSYAAVLDYYAPAMRKDLRPEIVPAPVGPGWYVQRPSRFTAPNALVILRDRQVVAARVP
jgi:hypothetical protein